MEVNSIVEALRATMDINNREQAEKQLHEVHKIIGFSPLLLQVVMTEQLDMPVRQAGAIYLKNVLTQSWQEKEVENPGDPVPFSVHEQDRQQIRDNVIEAIIHAAGPIRSQLCVIVSHIIKCDYPGRWAVLPEKIATFIQSENPMQWMGALMTLYQMVKVYEYKRPDERKILDDAMGIMLPLIYQRISFMMQDQSEASVLLQKQILKIYYAFIQNFLPQDVLTKEVFTQWMEVIRQIVDRPVPEETTQIDEDERPELAWWKVKKWATHILARVFERYGSPGNVTKEYNAFAEWYLKAFSGGIIAVLFKVLDQYRQKIYVAPRVMQQVLNYLNQGVSHAFSWKYMKPHFQTLIQEVLFPLMCHSDEDDELWNTDPQEYIRVKYDVFEDFLSPVIAAQTLFYSAASKRKEVLQKAMGFSMQVINEPNVNPRQKDGALHMIGAVAEVLLKRKIYKDQAEMMLVNHVYPEFTNESGFLRARACWVLKHFYLPVRVEAAIALQMLITEQEKAKQFIQPHIKPIILELLNVIRETESDDLTTVMQRLVCTYVEEVSTLAVEMMTHLASTFASVIDGDISESEEKSITALGLLNTMETILTVMEDQKEIMLQLEGIVLNVIGVIMQKEIMDFYEEMLSLVYSLL
ncbi:IPO7 [Mytilus edulis]|uniref:IPO7 n=1 Tax=Mytilus edulis TaxID=6550 RepID=A0A8S3S226_MYTED|nr:IPO7 [Mytilus edulis]